MSGAERGASRERSVRNIVGARSGFYPKAGAIALSRSGSAPIRSHHESRACTNPPRIHLCLQQLTKLSAYTSKIVRCEGEMEFVKYLYIIGYRLRGGRGAGLLRVDFPFRAYVNRLELLT